MFEGLAAQSQAQPLPQARAVRPFRHANHVALECGECHGTTESHGRVMLRGAQDCQRCHHSSQLAQPCSRCHETGALAAARYPIAQPLRVGSESRERALPFVHGQHETVGCAACHGDRAPFRRMSVSCADCHAEHHAVDADCIACHAPPRPAAHDRNSHLTCAGAGCHEVTRSFAEAPRTRSVCLACHQDQQAHRPGEACVDCHVLPPRARGGVGPASGDPPW
jgi:hypothetical protein